MESRIKQLREKRGLIQEILAVELGITQQMLSKYERYAQKGIQINEWKSHPVRCSRTTGSEFWGYRGNDVF